jgi:hypothetical protein
MAMQWLIDAPDVSATACLKPLSGMFINSFDHSTKIIAQYTLRMAAFIIRHPERKNDVAAQQIAGLESALRAYEVMRHTNALAKSPSLEALLEEERRGDLPGAVRKAYLQCSIHPAGKMSSTGCST